MAQPKPEDKTTLDQLLKLVEQLPPSEQERLVKQLKYQELQGETQVGHEQAAKGQIVSEEDALAQMKAFDQELRTALPIVSPHPQVADVAPAMSSEETIALLTRMMSSADSQSVEEWKDLKMHLEQDRTSNRKLFND